MVRVTVLGSGDAFGSGGRLHSAYLVEAPGTTFLIDCGPTVLQALKRMQIDPERLDAVLLSHLHGDHFGGVPFLLMDYRYDSARTRPFTIAGPRDTDRRVQALYAALYERSAGDPPPHPVTYQRIPSNEPVTVAGARITAMPVPHAPELECFGYRIEIAGRTILYSGDTAWTDAFLERTRDVDLFLCECSTFETRLNLHVSYPEIAANASRLGCRRLILTHLGREPLARMGEINLECARDGLVIEL